MLLLESRWWPLYLRTWSLAQFCYEPVHQSRSLQSYPQCHCWRSMQTKDVPWESSTRKSTSQNKIAAAAVLSLSNTESTLLIGISFSFLSGDQDPSGACVCPVGSILNLITNVCIPRNQCSSVLDGVCHLLADVGAGVGAVVAGLDHALDAAVKVKITA